VSGETEEPKRNRFRGLHWHVFDPLSKHKMEFLGLTQLDLLFPVKFACLLDRAFQNLVEDLGDFHNKKDPAILRAKRSLKEQQAKEIDAAMFEVNTGTLSQLFLPRTLQLETQGKGACPLADRGASGAGAKKKEIPKGGEVKGKKTAKAWWTANPSPGSSQKERLSLITKTRR
jgi:hypothetical protein